MTTPALAAAPLAGAPLTGAAAERAAADDGVFAGLLAGAAAGPAPLAPRVSEGSVLPGVSSELPVSLLPLQVGTLSPGASSEGPLSQGPLVAGLLVDGLPGPEPTEVLPDVDLPDVDLPDGSLLAAQVLGLVPVQLLPTVVPDAGSDWAPSTAAPAQVVGVPAVPAAGNDAAEALTSAVPAGLGAPREDLAGPQAPGTGPADGSLPAADAAGPATTPSTASTGDVGTTRADAPQADASARHETAVSETAGSDAGVPEVVLPEVVVPEVVVPPGPGAVGTPLAGTARADALLESAATDGPAQVRPAVAELARGLRDVGGGRASLVVRLDPPELGPVLVRLTVVDGRVDVQLRTSEAVAAAGLGTASAEVRSMLLEHGLDLSSFDVRSGDVLPDSTLGQRDASSDQGTPRRDRGADRSGSADGAGGPAGAVLDDSTADGTPAGTWL